jgi:AcrR family transcriptional regulator
VLGTSPHRYPRRVPIRGVYGAEGEVGPSGHVSQVSTVPSSETHRRADHVRNRAALLDAARVVFAEQGADAPIEEIVRRAGFAKGTFFRHFATKQVLVQALLADHLNALGDIASEINAGHAPGWETLSLMMERILDHLAHDRSLGEFLDRGAVDLSPEIAQARLRLSAEIDVAVRAAQALGEVRPDVSATDFPPIVLMITRTTARRYATHPQLGHRYLRLFLDGIRSVNATDLKARPLTPADVQASQGSGLACSRWI